MSRRRLFRRIAIAATAVACAAGLTLIGVAAWSALTPSEAPAAPTRTTVDSVASQSAPLPAAEPTRVEIPVIGFDARVLPMSTPTDRVLDPATLDDAYWLDDDNGLAGADATGTVYLVGHSSADGRAVFDPLVDHETHESTLEVGDEIVVTTDEGRVVYLVQAIKQYPKTSLADVEDLWTQSPGRLVVVTCSYDGTNSTASDNLVVYARLAPESAY